MIKNLNNLHVLVSLVVRTIIYFANMTTRDARTIQRRDREMNLYFQGPCGLPSQASVGLVGQRE